MSTSHLASSRIREIEHRSASACKFESSSVVITTSTRHEDDNNGTSTTTTNWRIKSKDNDDDDNDINDNIDINSSSGSSRDIVKCTTLAEGTVIRVPPMERSRGGWDDEHFHEHLKLPEGSSAGKGMVVMLEAIGRECVAVALSPYHSFNLGKTYVVHFGANGNLQTVLRRRINHNEAVDASFPSRVCAENHWVPYWIILQNGKLSAGVGKIPGQKCIGTMDDAMYNMLRSGMDAVRYVGIGNSALGRNARDVKVRNVVVTSIPGCFGLEGIPLEESSAGFMNILDQFNNGGGRNNDDCMNGDDGGDGNNNASGGASVPTDAQLLAEYERERSKARARAEKFGIEYKEPAPDAFLRWSEARRLRANPERGFITGIDTFSREEKAKADARKERFAKDEKKRKGMDEGDHVDRSGDDDDGGRRGQDGEENMEDDDAPDDVAEWEKTKWDPLPIEKAWDNWELVQRFRVDPPTSLWSNAEGRGDIELSDSYSNDIWHGNGGNNECTDAEGKPDFIPKHIVMVPTKIHIFAIDWVSFKQIRTDDLMSYFKDYGPSYVEWLGELSCNILFEDRHSAARAYHALSQELPSPPPGSLIENAASGEVDESKDDGMEGETADALEDATGKQEGGKPLPDFGGMGWRFCKWTVRKVNNDHYGRRGTRARVLMRLATSADILDDRPTEWPRPPPGFTTKRVLMPGDDFKRRHQRGRRDTKRRRRDGRRGSRGYHDDEYDDEYDEKVSGDGEHPLLSKGLSSGRAGFSVEELEAERVSKCTTEELS